MRIFACIPALVLAVFVFGAGSVKADEPLKFEPAVVKISGRHLTSYVALGGDKMIKGAILHLGEPVTIEGNPESSSSKRTIGNVRKILLEPEEGVELPRGQVTLEGRLFHEPNVYHHTEVLMKVEKVVQAGD